MGPFGITQLDAHRLRAGLAELARSDPKRAERVGERARASLDRLAQRYPESRQKFDDEICPALDPETRTCDLYAARPVICRTFGPPVRGESGSLGVCEKCFQGASDEEIAACSVEVDTDDAEARLIEEVEKATGASGATIVAACLAED
jgi:Fe-S-cluster containining protein